MRQRAALWKKSVVRRCLACTFEKSLDKQLSRGIIGYRSPERGQAFRSRSRERRMFGADERVFNERCN